MDANRNGGRDGFERGIAGTVYVDLNADGARDANEVARAVSANGT